LQLEPKRFYHKIVHALLFKKKIYEVKKWKWKW